MAIKFITIRKDYKKKKKVSENLCIEQLGSNDLKPGDVIDNI